MPNISQMEFWSNEEGNLWDDIAELMLTIYLSGVDSGVDALPPNLRVLVDFDRVNRGALEFAKTYRYSWIKKITDTTRQQTQTAIANWIQSGAPLEALDIALEPIYGRVRAEMISQTETTRIYAAANRDAFEASGLVDEVVWQTAVDDLVCEICGELNGTHIGVGDVDAYPPAHIRCRCYVLPVVSKERLAERIDEALA